VVAVGIDGSDVEVAPRRHANRLDAVGIVCDAAALVDMSSRREIGKVLSLALNQA
jgi:hypothetical protein